MVQLKITRIMPTTLKTTSFFTILLVLSIFFTACEEVPPFIDFSAGALSDTTYLTTDIPAAQEKSVVIEEFTGVKCVNCPAGHEAIAAIVNTFGERVIPIGIHATILAEPYDESLEDYRTELGSELSMTLQAVGLPAAAVDRVKFDDQTLIVVLNKDLWTSKVADQLENSTPVNISFPDIQFDAETKDLEIFVQLDYTQTISDTHRLGITITENNIVDLQLTPTGVEESYTQKHVFRAMLTPPSGTPIDANLEAGRVVIKSFGLDGGIPSNWNPDNLEVVAFVLDAETGHIIHGASHHIVE